MITTNTMNEIHIRHLTKLMAPILALTLAEISGEIPQQNAVASAANATRFSMPSMSRGSLMRFWRDPSHYLWGWFALSPDARAKA
jgi:hypothetical protein